jgi:MFS transporter, FHS family, L-fucose permease
MTSERPVQASPASGGASSGNSVATAYVTTLFFAWGFVTSMIDPLIASVRGVFQLSFAEAMLTQFAWFIAYAVVSLPAAALLGRLGYSMSITLALSAMVLGCLLVPLATLADFYPGVLAALFVIASGVTLLQVAANPLAASLGRPESSHFRLMFSQAFNSLGTVAGPYFGAVIMLSGGVFAGGVAVAVSADRAASLRAIDLAFLGIGGFFAVLAFFLWTARKRIQAAAPAQQTELIAPWRAFRSGWALFGALAIFLYVGSEVAVGSMMTNFLHQDAVLGLPLEEAGKLVSVYWLGAMIGRFIGTALLTRVSAGLLLTIAAAFAAAMCLVVSQTMGVVAGYAALSIGFFNSIMFPSIFTLTLERSSAPASATSGLLCMAIVGGAVLPLVAGMIVDASPSMGPAFFVPLLGYLGIAVFAASAAGARAKGNRPIPATVSH